MDQRARFEEAWKLWGLRTEIANSERARIAEVANAAVLAAAIGLIEAAGRNMKRRKGYRAVFNQGASTAARVSAALSLLGEDCYPNLRAVRAPYDAELEALDGRSADMLAALKKELHEAAQGAEVRRGEWRKLTEVYTSMYSTQGFGASRYARQSAELTASMLPSLGVEARVERLCDEGRKRGPNEYYDHTERFVVWVAVEGDLDVEICKRKTVDTREWVRSCWKRGVNPRVYDPFLPAGYEERVGLDYFGGERRAG